MSDAAVEARRLIRRAAGDVAGKTVAGQIKQAGRHLGYAPDDWRPRELWYGRCAGAAALHDLRERHRAWSEREAARAAAADPSTLAARIAAVRRLLGRLVREVEALEKEVGRQGSEESTPGVGDALNASVKAPSR